MTLKGDLNDSTRTSPFNLDLNMIHFPLSTANAFLPGVAKLKGDIDGIPRVLDAGQCNDAYSLVRIAIALRDAFALDDVNGLPLSFDIAWYEQILSPRFWR